MSQQKPYGNPRAQIPSPRLTPRPGRKPELESDVHPQRHPGDKPMPDESDNIPGDENDPSLVQSRQ